MLVNTSGQEVSYLSGYGLAGMGRTASALALAVNVTVAPPPPVPPPSLELILWSKLPNLASMIRVR